MMLPKKTPVAAAVASDIVKLDLSREEAEKLLQLAVASAVDHSVCFDSETDTVQITGKKALKSLLRILRNEDADIVPAADRAECARELRSLADKVAEGEAHSIEATWTFGGMLVTKAVPYGA